MNIFEYCKFQIFQQKIFKYALKDTVDNLYSSIKTLLIGLSNIVMLLLFPITFPIIGYFTIRSAKNEVKKLTK